MGAYEFDGGAGRRDPMHDLVEVGRYDVPGKARDGALVLASAGIDTLVVHRAGEIGLAVAAGEQERARGELAAFARENDRAERPAADAWRPEWLTAALAYTAVLTGFFVISGKGAFGIDWLEAGHAAAGEIVGGAWQRTVTALTLHADFGHLLSNIVAGGLIGILLAQVLGVGLAWAAMLAAGAAGNLLNAVLQSPTHAAIGASTAVFAGLGLLAATSWQRPVAGVLRSRAWVPLAAAVMLLAFTGFGGERVDIGGHVAGFASGLALGWLIRRAGDRLPAGPAAQVGWGVAAAALLALSWAVALA